MDHYLSCVSADCRVLRIRWSGWNRRNTGKDLLCHLLDSFLGKLGFRPPFHIGKKSWMGYLGIFVVLYVGAVASAGADEEPGVSRLVAVLSSASGSQASGIVWFSEVSDGIRVQGELKGLVPYSKHGFHVHEFGDISKADGTAAGDHYNPAGLPHGLPEESVRHAGDLGNIEANDAGVATFDFVVEGVTLAGKAELIGRGLIIHEKPDDGSQPAGYAGARIAQGVIGIARPSAAQRVGEAVGEAGKEVEEVLETAAEQGKEFIDAVKESIRQDKREPKE